MVRIHVSCIKGAFWHQLLRFFVDGQHSNDEYADTFSNHPKKLNIGVFIFNQIFTNLNEFHSCSIILNICGCSIRLTFWQHKTTAFGCCNFTHRRYCISLRCKVHLGVYPNRDVFYVLINYSTWCNPS